MKKKLTEKFINLPISDKVKEALAEINYDMATEIQTLVIPEAAKKVDILGQAQTGTGKTLAFCIPIVENITTEKYVQAIILTPTRELAKQVGDESAKLTKFTGMKHACIYGGASTKDQIQQIRNGVQIIVGTPGRVMDLIQQKVLKLDKVKVAVLDEVDRMLDMGFYEIVEKIMSKMPEKRQTLFFSATIPASIQKMGRKHLNRPVILSTSDDSVMATTTEHFFYEVSDRKRFSVLKDVLDFENPTLAIIFCKTKGGVDRVQSMLKENGYDAVGLHGDMSQIIREKVMKKYRAGTIRFLVATDLAARGIDIVGVSLVVNYHLPYDAESFVHRTGRTGRAGQAGKSISFVSPGDYFELLKIQEGNSLHITKVEIPSAKEILLIRVKNMIDEIRKNLGNADVDAVYKEIKKKIPINKRGKALAYVLKTYIDNGHNFLYSPKQTRLFINLGRYHKANEKDLKKFILQKTKIDEAKILNISVHDKFSFINVDQSIAQGLIKSLKKSKYDKYTVNVELSRDKPKGSAPRSTGTRSSGPRVSSNNSYNKNRSARPNSSSGSSRPGQKRRTTGPKEKE